MIVPEISRSMLKNATVLGLFAIVTVGAVTLLQQGTAERIRSLNAPPGTCAGRDPPDWQL